MRRRSRPLARCTMQLSAAFSAIRGKATIAILVVFGLLLIPVECSVALGPHTLFVSADAIAALQGDEASHSSHHADSHDASTDATSDLHAPAKTPHPPDANTTLPQSEHGPALPDTADASGTHFSSTPTRPAGISADAVMTIALPGDNPPLLATNDTGDALCVVYAPPDRLLIEPEPPPP